MQVETEQPSTGRAAALLHSLRTAPAAGRSGTEGLDQEDLACLVACGTADGPGPVALMRELAERQVYAKSFCLLGSFGYQ